VRLDLAGADWPNSWPPPGTATLTFELEDARLVLPVVPGPAPIEVEPAFAVPKEEAPGSPSASAADLETRAGVRGSGGIAPDPVWRVEQGVLAREARTFVEHGSDTVLENGSISIERYEGENVVSTTNPAIASARGRARFTLQWPEVSVTSESRTLLSSDEESWHLEIELDVSEGEELRWQRRWEHRFPRRLG
jgi:hypothetical protein